MRNKQIILATVILSMVSLAFQWPWDVQQQAQKKNAQGADAKAAVNDSNRKSQSVGFENASSKNILKSNKSAYERGSSEEMVSDKVSTSVASKDFGEVAALQQRIDNIIKVNETLKTASGAQAREISQIGDQARAHQKILAQMAAPAGAGYSVTDAGEVLRQEKLRLIQSQTQKNQELLESIKRTESIRR